MSGVKRVAVWAGGILWPDVCGGHALMPWREHAGREEEIERLREENDDLHRQLQDKIDEINIPCADALTFMWKKLFPKDYGRWEYPGQAARHVIALVNELGLEIKKKDEYIQEEAHRLYEEKCSENKSLRAHIEELERIERCEHCGFDTIYSGPPDCPDCGAPNCCQFCCRGTTIEQLRRRVEELEHSNGNGFVMEKEDKCSST